MARPMAEEGPEEGLTPLSDSDPRLERAIQLYLELRLKKRPPESAPGAARKTLQWLGEEVARTASPLPPDAVAWLERAFLDVEGDVAEATARRHHRRRSAPREPRAPSASRVP